LGPEGYLRRTLELGLAGVHFADLGHFPTLEPAYLRGLREQAERDGLYLELGTGGTDPAHLEMALHAAAALGSPVLRTFVGAFRWQADVPMREVIERAARDLREVLPLAERLGVRIALENHLDLATQEMVALLEMVGSECLGVCLDTGNPLGLLEDPVEAAETFASYTFTTHLKEFKAVLRRTGLVLRGVSLGQGDVPNVEIVGILRARSPLGEDLCLNIETAVERVTIPMFSGTFLASLPGLDANRLAGFLSRLALDDPLGDDRLALPEELGYSPEETLSMEHAQVAQSAAWALEHFG
jgi:sugar phosphate isomerase/epimerase